MKKMTRRFLSLLLALMLVLSLGVTALAVDEGDLPEEALCTEAHPEEDMQIPADEDVPGAGEDAQLPEEDGSAAVYPEADTQVPDEAEIPSAGEDAQLPEEDGSAEAQSSITPCAHRYVHRSMAKFHATDGLKCLTCHWEYDECTICRNQVNWIKITDATAFHSYVSSKTACDGWTVTTTSLCGACNGQIVVSSYKCQYASHAKGACPDYPGRS